jgi:NADH-quinone oxidoreductase subunit E
MSAQPQAVQALAFSDATLARFAREVAKYPADQKQSAVMACLSIVQQEQGHVSAAAEKGIGRLPGHARDRGARGHHLLQHVQPAPVGKFKLNVCTNLPCQLRDGSKALAHLEKKLGITWAKPRPTACSPCSKANAWAPAPTRR